MIGRRTDLAGAACLLGAGRIRAQRRPRVVILSSIVTLERLSAAMAAAAPVAERGGLQNWSYFFDELRRRGYRDGENVVIELRSVAVEHDAHVRAAAIREVVAAAPDVIVADNSGFVRQVMAATSTIPIVVNVADPIEGGIVRNLGRPEGNVTGVGLHGIEIEAKRIQMLVEMAPAVRRVAYAGLRSLLEFPGVAAQFPQTVSRLAAQGIEMVVVPVEPAASREPADVERWNGELVAALRRAGCGGMVYRGSFGTTDNADIARRLIEAGIATNGDNPPFVLAGGLMAYSNNRQESFAAFAGSLVRILEGATPAEVPFWLPTRYDLFINARTAAALGLVIPPSLAVMATEIIE